MTSTARTSNFAEGGLLVTGGSGALGRILRHHWDMVPQITWQSRTPAPGFRIFDPLTDEAAFAEAAQNVAALYCLSGVTPAYHRRTGAPFSLNADLACAAIRAAEQGQARRVFLMSSAAVYGRATGRLQEEMPCTPVSDYGRAKLDMEEAALALGRARNVPVTILRIGNVVGADAIVGGWHADMALDCDGQGNTPRRSYIGPAGLSRALAGLAQEKDLPDCINIAAGAPVAMGALLDEAGLPWTSRTPGADVIWTVSLETVRLEKHVRFTPEERSLTGMVQEWRRMEGGKK
ncbi:NAD(P)-dependent oxidoreductase [Thalassococcus sp. S3]|uniref:NAD-dependent epimerase/dehydratase family protein n=1 Tax=Thalassococcus sp. S3 TaxID=2017482 RepID=UPI00102437F2|nr:NAD(P)-dependent oxidoreductase [Thalassococcus sp. S3]QBF34193.1 NAD-dependent epimerase [Thalassococcus sp. S3]